MRALKICKKEKKCYKDSCMSTVNFYLLCKEILHKNMGNNDVSVDMGTFPLIGGSFLYWASHFPQHQRSKLSMNKYGNKKEENVSSGEGEHTLMVVKLKTIVRLFHLIVRF